MASQTITALGNAIINLIDRKTPIATANTVGMVKPDGSTINIDANGVISSNGGGGSGLEVCDIGMALYVDETKGLRRYLNGQIVDINTNTQAFLDRLKQIQTTNPDYFTTEDNWQAEATLNIDGCVYKFVLNYSGETVVSVRLPKYPDYVEINAGGTLPVVGNGIALGLTDGTNNFGTCSYSSNYAGYSNNYGSAVGSERSGSAYTSTLALGVTTDPTKSGIQTTLKQTKLKMRYFIQIATGRETENNIINDIELNNPYSLFDSKYSDHELNNLSWLKSEGQWNSKSVYPTAYDKLLKVYNGVETVEGLSVKLSTASNITDYDFVLNTADETFRLPLLDGSEDLPSDRYEDLELNDSGSTYTAPANGYYVIEKRASANGQYLYFGHISIPYCQNGYYCKIIHPIKKGDSISIAYDLGGATELFRFIYAQGNGTLYFYVGETVQNASLIDAGRIGEQLASLIPDNSSLISGYGMPSNKYIDLTLGASGSTYTAPANGYVTVFGNFQNANGFLYILDITGDRNNCSVISKAGSGDWTCAATLLIRKGHTFEVTYNYNPTTVSYGLFRFYYAEGEV